MLNNGFTTIEGFISPGQIKALTAELEMISFPASAGGIRNIEKKSSAVRNFCRSSHLLSTASKFLEGEATLVRAIFFNKTPDQNWLVTWHQDKTVAVSDVFELEGWGPWSNKDGTHHVQPPLDVLNKMVTIRIHLDDATPENGCLRVIPDSHAMGNLSQEQINRCVENNEPFNCTANKGDALVMRPHILHASSKATVPSQRRILHFEYSDYKLPENITWATNDC